MNLKKNSSTFIFVFLGMLTAFGPFVTDMYLPTLPAMAVSFGTTSSMVQLGLTASMIGLAVGQLFFGPISDKYGRRVPLIMAMLLFLVSTLGCLFSANIMQFVVWRLVQGVSGAGGIVISRSVAADLFSGKELAKMLALIGAINGVAPVTAPIVGGSMADTVGWYGIFWVLFGLGVVLLMGSIRFCESHPKERRQDMAWLDVYRSFKAVTGNQRYVCYILQYGFAQGVLFANIASSPFIVQQHYGFSAFAFSLCFGVNALAIGVAAALSVKFHRPESCTLAGCCGMAVVSVVQCAALVSGCSFWVYEGLMLCLLFSMGMTFTSSTALAMESQREHSGTASALLGAVCFAAGGVVSPLVGMGNILSSTGITFVVCAFCSLACMLVALGRRRSRLYFAFSTSQKR